MRFVWVIWVIWYDLFRGSKNILSMTLEAKEYEFDNVIEDVKKVIIQNRFI